MAYKKASERTTSNVGCSNGETLFFCGTTDKGAIMVMGIGTVCNVQKGEQLDQVIMHFGKKTRPLIVINNHARRQIFELKRGQYAWFVGFMTSKEGKNGKRKMFIYANGFLPWYVPKMLDIKKYDTSELEKLEEDNDTDLTNFLDDILKEN